MSLSRRVARLEEARATAALAAVLEASGPLAPEQREMIALLAAETTPAALRPAVAACFAACFAEPDPPLAAALDRLSALYEELRARVVAGGGRHGVSSACLWGWCSGQREVRCGWW